MVPMLLSLLASSLIFVSERADYSSLGQKGKYYNNGLIRCPLFFRSPKLSYAQEAKALSHSYYLDTQNQPGLEGIRY